MAKQLGLGWPFPSGLPQGTDWEFLRRIFGDLSKFLSWPLVGLEFEGPTALSINPINFTVIPGFDESSLYRTATDRIYCPQDFSQYLAVGTVGAHWTTTATGRTSLLWRKNGTITLHGTVAYNDASDPREAVPIIEPMNKGEYLTVSTASNVGGTDLEAARAFVFFIPLR